MEEEGAEGKNWDRMSPEVLVMIFDHLPVADLLSCSVVSKNWKEAARDVLKRSRECYAHIKHFHREIQQLDAMIATTDIMQIINGLHIRNEASPMGNIGVSLWQRSKHYSDVARMLQSERAERKLDEAKQKVLSVLCGQWRYLDLDMGWGHAFSLDEALLLREVILSASDSLQKLIMGNWEDWKLSQCHGKPFSQLEVVQAQKRLVLYSFAYVDSSIFKFAPNLKMITGAMVDLPVPFDGEVFMLELMKSIRAFPECQTCENLIKCPIAGWVVPQGEAKEAFRAVSGLHRLDLQIYHRHPFDGCGEQNLGQWNALVLPFVLRSLKTLKELRMFTVDLCNLSMASDGLKFPNLRRLSLATHWNVSRANKIWNLKNLNLPKLCPFLEQLEVTEEHCNRDVEEEVIPVEELDELDQSEMPLAIDLKCRDGEFNQEQVKLFGRIYPKISKLRILKLKSGSDYDASKIFLSSFWDLQSLEYLEISVPDPPRRMQFHIEAFLSGINIEEAQLPSLRSRRKEDMLNSCIVPIRPSLLNAKSLKELKITVETRCLNRLRRLDRSESISRSWLIQVTENLPERHVRNLKVTFDANKRLCDSLVGLRAFTWLRAIEIKP